MCVCLCDPSCVEQRWGNWGIWWAKKTKAHLNSIWPRWESLQPCRTGYPKVGQKEPSQLHSTPSLHWGGGGRRVRSVGVCFSAKKPERALETRTPHQSVSLYSQYTAKGHCLLMILPLKYLLLFAEQGKTDFPLCTLKTAQINLSLTALHLLLSESSKFS